MNNPISHLMKLRSFFAFAVCLLSIFPAHAQWIQTHGPAGGKVSCLAHLGATTFAGTEGGGLFRMTDQNSPWVSIKNRLNEPTVYALAVIGTSLFANTDDGLFRSQDQGETWISVQSTQSQTLVRWTSPPIYDPATTIGLCVIGNSLIIRSGSFYRTDDLGASWILLTPNSILPGISSCLDLGDRILAARQDGIFLSRDLGVTWVSSGVGLYDPSVTALAAGTGALYAGTSFAGVSISLDSGAHWKASNAGLQDTAIKALYAVGDTVLAGTHQGGVFRSVDRGAHWASANTGLGNAHVLTLLKNGRYVMAGTLGGVYRSGDMGSHWESLLDGLAGGNATHLLQVGPVLFAAMEGGEIYATRDQGDHWTRPNSGLPIFTVNAMTAFQGALIVAGDRGLFRSADSGVSWNRVDTGVDQRIFNGFVVQGRYLYTAAYWPDEIFRSVDGIHWNSLGADGKYHLPTVSAVSGEYLFAGYNDGVARSRDSGQTWQDFSMDLFNSTIFSLAASGGNLFAGANRGAYRRLATDTAWVPITGLPFARVEAFAFQNNRVFAATDSGIFRSSDSGKTWLDMGANLGIPWVTSIEIANGQFYAAVWNGGVWKRTLEEMTSRINLPAPRIPARMGASARLTRDGNVIYNRNGAVYLIHVDGSSVQSIPKP